MIISTHSGCNYYGFYGNRLAITSLNIIDIYTLINVMLVYQLLLEYIHNGDGLSVKVSQYNKGKTKTHSFQDIPYCM